MKKLLFISSLLTITCGLAPLVSAQPSAGKAADLQGLEQRSVRMPIAAATESRSLTQETALGVEDPTDVGVVLRQLDARTQLVFSPARDNLQRWETERAGLTGDHKVEVVYDLQQP